MRLTSIGLAIAAFMGLAGCDPCTFHCTAVNVKSRADVVDFGPYRVVVSDVGSLAEWGPKYAKTRIPETRVIDVAWSPAEIARLHRQKGYRPATDSDWLRSSQALLAWQIDTFERSGRPKMAEQVRRRAAKPGLDIMTAHNKQRLEKMRGYEAVVFPDGSVGSCALENARWCGKRPVQLSRKAVLRLGEAALEQAGGRCRIVATNPEAVMKQLTKGQDRSGTRLWVEVAC